MGADMFLHATVASVDQLTRVRIDEMYGLYAGHYQATSEIWFRRDLTEKDSVILMQDDRGMLRGFTTLKLLRDQGPDGPARFIFSGDTIVHPDYWARNNLIDTWMQHAGRIWAAESDLPLYWFLIVKGHRTYRYLPTLIRDYYPRHDAKTPEPVQKTMHHLGQATFGESYDPTTGIAHFNESRGHLVPELAEIPEKDLRRPYARYFLERNPGYRQGDELICLAELAPENLKSYPRRAFMRGVADVTPRAEREPAELTA